MCYHASMQPDLQSYQAILFDIDNTLTNSNREISPRVARALQMLDGRGITIGVCTARDRAAFASYASQFFPQKALHVLSNGAQIMRGSGEVLEQHLIPEKTIQTVCTVLLQQKAEIIVTGAKYVYATPEIYSNIQHHPWHIPVKPLVQLEDWVATAIVVYKLTPQSVSVIKEQPGISFIHYDKGVHQNIDIMAAGVNKGTGVKQWSNHTSIPPENIIGIGDGQNDFEFLRTVGYSVAMGNAHPEIKQQADKVIGHTDEDGLALFLEEVLDAYIQSTK